MEKTRNNTIDLLRLLAAFAVICLHNFSGSGLIFAEETVALSRFAVPLFFMFSGYFAAKFTAARKWKQAAKLFLLAVFSNAAYLLLELSKTGSYRGAMFRLREIITEGSIKRFVLFNEPVLTVHLWFLSALLYCVLLDILFTWLLKGKKYRRGILTAGAVVLLFGGLLLYHIATPIPTAHFQLYHYRNFLLFGAPFYILGRLMRDSRLSEKALPAWAYVLLLAGSSVLTVLEFKLMGTWELYMGSVIFALTLMQLAMCHPLSNVGAPVRAVAGLGRIASLPIYIVHMFFLDLLRNIYYTYLPWQYEFGLLHLIPLGTFLISLAVGAACGETVQLFKRLISKRRV